MDYRETLLEMTAASLAGWEPEQPDPTVPPAALVGFCPRCTHQMTAPLVRDIPIAAGVEERDVAPPADHGQQMTRRIDCRCGEPHPRRPASKKTGCGAYWHVTLKPSDDGWTIAPGDQALRSAADALAAQVAGTPITDIRKAAEKWLGGLAALYGLFSLSGAVVGKDAAGALSHNARVGVAALGLAAIFAAVVSIISGYLAAYGWPRIDEGSTDQQLADWYLRRAYEETLRVPKAIAHLHRAVKAAVTTLALLSTAIGMLWLGPTASAPKPLVRVTFTRNGATSSICGELRDSVSGSLDLMVTDGPRTTTESISSGSLSMVHVVKKC